MQTTTYSPSFAGSIISDKIRNSIRRVLPVRLISFSFQSVSHFQGLIMSEDRFQHVSRVSRSLAYDVSTHRWFSSDDPVIVHVYRRLIKRPTFTDGDAFGNIQEIDDLLDQFSIRSILQSCPSLVSVDTEKFCRILVCFLMDAHVNFVVFRHPETLVVPFESPRVSSERHDDTFWTF